MLKMIDKKNGKSIWKSSGMDRKTGAEVVNFYGVRATGAVNKPFDSQHNTLRDARESLDTS